ncbi:MAG TPA: tetratricopeptide repeat protein [Bryobacteraceae bacterium]|nr:tetratricopeptide repeat protein [Bryobacteraceae bacterium]
MRLLNAVFLILLLVGGACWGQGNAPVSSADRATAYYHYTLAHMYAELAGASTNRTDYVNNAIENYKAALKADPSSPLMAEELSDLYSQSGRMRDGQNDGEQAIKLNPNDLAAHRILARIYVRQIDAQRGRVNEQMLRQATQEYQKITELAPKDANAWVWLGRLQSASQNTDAAERAFRKALDLEPDNEDGLTGLATVLGIKGDGTGAANLLKRAAEKDPSAESLTRLADAYEQMKEYGLAADTLRRALESNPPNGPELERKMAMFLISAERYDDALAAYQELVNDDPTDADSYLRMSQLYRQKRDLVKAREASDKAKGIDPNSVEIKLNETYILRDEGKASEAIENLRSILQQSQRPTYTPDQVNARVQLLEQLAVMQQVADQTQPAVDSYRQIAAVDPSKAPHASAMIIGAYMGGKEFAKAQDEADAAVKKFPNDREVRVSRASLLAEMGKTDAAVADVKKLIDGKNDLAIQLALSDLYVKGKKFDDAAKALDAAEKLSESQEEKIDVWFKRGAMFERQKNVAAAETEFRKVLAVMPDNPATLNYLGYMLTDRNIRLPEALAMIQKAVDSEPNNGAYLDSLGWVYFRMGRLPEAEDNMRRAVDLVPRDPTMHDHYAEVLFKASKVREAIAQWETSLREWQASSPAELDSAEMAKVKDKLENARVQLARQNNGRQ